MDNIGCLVNFGWILKFEQFLLDFGNYTNFFN